MNLAGLVPFGATATSNIMITAGLAIVAFFMIQISAIRSQGMKHYLLHLTGDVHWILWVIMVPIEILGLFTKPFALCMRLFANMSGGHIVILSLIGLILNVPIIYRGTDVGIVCCWHRSFGIICCSSTSVHFHDVDFAFYGARYAGR